MKKLILLFFIVPFNLYAENNTSLYEHYLDMCMNNDPSDFVYCQCIGRCMAEKTDEVARKYFEKDWFYGVCGTECDRWYNNVYNRRE